MVTCKGDLVLVQEVIASSVGIIRSSRVTTAHWRMVFILYALITDQKWACAQTVAIATPYHHGDHMTTSGFLPSEWLPVIMCLRHSESTSSHTIGIYRAIN